MRRVLLGLAVAVVWTVPAQARIPSTLNGRYTVALAVAEKAWGARACDRPAMSWGHIQADEAMHAWTDTCSIVMSQDVWNGPRRMDTFAFWQFCTLVVHEYGHLLGYGHSTDPRAVMYPVPRAVWGGCAVVDRKRFFNGGGWSFSLRRLI